MSSALTAIKQSRTREEIKSFLETNYDRLTNPEIADVLGIKLSMLRTICYELGYKRMELEYFSDVQIAYLKRHYRAKGDIELAELFQRKWPKQKGWTNKHIEKKRRYLNLHRTIEQIKKIHQRNVKTGRFKICPVKAWNKRGRIAEGDIRYWSQYKTGRKYPVIKHNGHFIHWTRWAWERKYGKIPKGMNAIFKDGNPYHLTEDNIALVSNAALAKINSQRSSQVLSDNYIAGLLTPHNPALRKTLKQHPHLIEIKRKQLTLNRIIYEQQKIS